MLPSFIYKNSKGAKRKTKTPKLNIAIRKGLQPPPSPASFESPQIFDIHERSRGTSAPSTDSVPMRFKTEDQESSYVSDMQAQDSARDTPSPRVQLEFNTEPLSDWFPMSMLRPAESTFLESLEGENGIGRSRSLGFSGGALDNITGSISIANSSAGAEGASTMYGSGSINGSKSMLDLDSEDRASMEPDLTETSTSMDPSSEDLSTDRSTPRKGVPAPITIPNMTHHGPKVQVQHTATPVDPTTSKMSFTRASTLAHSRPNSEVSVDDLSAVSGTTLARALIANSFTLSSESRTFRYRGVTRQDSATLPRGEYPLINSPYWCDKRIANGEIVVVPGSGDGTAIPPVPQMPSVDVPMMRRKGRNPKPSTASRNRSQRDTEHRRSNSLKLQRSPSPPNTLMRSASTGTTSSQRVQVRASRRISRISEASSLSPSDPSTPIREPRKDQSQPFRESLMLSRNREGAETDVPTTALSMHTDHLRNSIASLSPPLPEDSEAVLDDFLFLSPLSSSRESQPSASTTSSSSASAPKIYSNRMKRNSKKFKGGKVVNTTSSGSSARGSRLEFNLPQVRSESRIAALTSRENIQNRSFALLPIGERPNSLLVPQSPLTSASVSEPAILSSSIRVSSRSQLAIVPPSNHLSLSNTPNSSPDILDTLLAPVSRNLFVRQRSGSTPNPITVFRGSREADYIMGSDGSASAGNTPSTGSVGAQQTFPETPSAFSPLWTTTNTLTSPGSLARSPGGSLVSGSMFIVPQSAPLGLGTFGSSIAGLTQQVLAEVKNSSRHSTSSSTKATIHPSVRSSASVAPTTPLTPPKEEDASLPASDEARSISTFDNNGLPGLPMDEPSSPAPASSEIHIPSPCMESSEVHAVEPSVSTSALQMTPSDTASSSLEPAQTPAITPNSADETSFQLLPPPTTSLPERFSSSYSLSPHLSFVPPPPYQEATPENATGANNVDAQVHSEIHPLAQFVMPPPPPPITTEQSQAGPSQAPESPPYTSSASTMGSKTPDSATSIVAGTVTVNGRKTRVRPPLPIGPRKPSAASPAPSSVTSFPGRARKASVSSITEGMGTGDDAASGSRRLTSIMTSPKFSTSPPKWKGYTMEAAKWTFTSKQLQSIVSRAIKQSAQASYIRLLQLETYDDEIPKEIRQLEQQKAEYKTRYKMLTRKRWTLLGTLAAHAEGGQSSDAAASIRLLDTLAEVSATLDKLTEDIHYVTDQLGQLRSLRDIHSGSALAMALRKLNASFLSKATENDHLRKRIAALEAERDEAWRQAEDVAHEFDDLNDKFSYRENFSARSTTSLRSSRVMAVRKSSVRVSKAGLRSSGAMRSQRSSVASASRGSSVPSSAALGSSYTSEDIPPVPPLPLKRSLGIVTADLPTQSSGLVSSVTPDSAVQALMQAQQELYEMLGIHFTEPKARRPRPRSMSCVVPEGSRLPTQASAHRPISDITTPGHPVTSFLPDPVSSKLIDPSYQDREDMLVATLGLFSS